MNMSRVSSCTICLHDRALGPALDIISNAGFKNIDLLARLPHFSIDPEECDHYAIEKMVAERGMQIANLGTYEGGSFVSESEDERETGLVKKPQRSKGRSLESWCPNYQRPFVSSNFQVFPPSGEKIVFRRLPRWSVR